MLKLLPIAVSFLAFAACQSGLGHGPLDGRMYQVELAGGGQPAAPDFLVFDGGRFESTACRAFGFNGAGYEAVCGAAEASFQASPSCSKAGTTAWNGRIVGDAIEGTMQWTDATGRVTDLHFKGRTASGQLDGKTFVGMLCEGDSTSGDEDTLVFGNGAFDSQACRAYGFTMAPYTATRDGDRTHFKAEATNACGETNVWEGTLEGEQLEGTMQHKDSDGKVSGSYRWKAHVKA